MAQSLHLKSWDSSALVFDNVVEAEMRTDRFDIQIHRTRWLDRAPSSFKPALPFIEMMLTPTPLVHASYQSRPDRSDLVRLGDVTFIPQGATLHCLADPGNQRTVSCMFDIERLSARTDHPWQWADFDANDALDIGNDYIRTGMRRIAEELVSPGFASTAQIESSLMFIATELLRVFGRDRKTAPTGLLSRRQISRLYAMAMESTGETPGLGDFADELDMCARSLATAIRRTTGMTFRTFVAGIRLEKAKILLLDGGLVIKQVAFDCGFKSSASFTAAFRKATGMTPAVYRGPARSGQQSDTARHS
jgi:AraC family transcriptional regulator